MDPIAPEQLRETAGTGFPPGGKQYQVFPWFCSGPLEIIEFNTWKTTYPDDVPHFPRPVFAVERPDSLAFLGLRDRQGRRFVKFAQIRDHGADHLKAGRTLIVVEPTANDFETQVFSIIVFVSWYCFVEVELQKGAGSCVFSSHVLI